MSNLRRRAYISGAMTDTTKSDPAPAAAKEDPSVRHQVLKVQDYLNRLGYRVPETGELDLRTTEAIRAFEQSMKMVVTGAADDLLAQSLVEEFDRRDRAAWEKATKTDTEAAFRAYQQDYPMGAFVGDVEFSVEASNQRKADRERRARDARIAEQKKQEEAARLAEEARQAEAARQAELARQEQLRQEEQRRAQVALALQQCDTKCSRNRRNCEADNNPRDCRIEQCQGGYGGDPLMQLGGLLQCKQDAERDYRDCQREAREYLAECPIIEQDCKQDCRFKHTL